MGNLSYVEILTSCGVGFSVALLLSRVHLALMSSSGVGQYIRQWGPNLHQHKSGTPTMGGIPVLAGLVAGSGLLFTFSADSRPYLILLVVGTFSFGFIGLVDDLLSLWREQAKGLSVQQKLVAQIVVAAIFHFLADFYLSDFATLVVPFHVSSLYLNTPLHCLLNVILLVSVVNACNLTDGLDGLLAGSGILILSGLAAVAPVAVVPITLVMISCLFAFLWFNSYPADLFLGDTGSFAIGGFLGSLVIISRTQLYLPLIGGLLVLETVSVIVQVFSYKVFGHRVFKITPLHHHFERAEGIDYEYYLPTVEWAEPKVTVRLWTVQALFVLLGVTVYLF
ncbi:MAG: phospho-N-acetylmuramoyl-pentapeptide-transferase [Candidatus Acetothermia bacterium]